MGDLVEEVRLALCEVAHAINAKMGIPEDKQVPYGMEEMNALSAAAISAVFDAIAEPNNEQIRAAIRAGAVSSGINQKRDVGTHYRAMIAALRKEFVPLQKPPSGTP